MRGSLLAKAGDVMHIVAATQSAQCRILFMP